MSFPAGITRREVTQGVPFGLADGSDLIVEAVFRPTRNMVWAANGFPGVATEYRVTSQAGMQLSVLLPVTDQAGWLDGAGNVLSVAGGAQTHGYAVETRISTPNGRVVQEMPIRNIVLPAGDLSAIDLDLMLPVSTVGGVTVWIPDGWSQAVADAQAAAAAAATMPVGGFLSGNMPNPGVNQTALSNAMLARTPIYWQPNTYYATGTKVISPLDGSTVRRLASGTSGTVYDASAWEIVVASAASVAATYVTYDGTNLLKAGTVIPVSSSASSGVALDTDGVPYFSTGGSTAIALDTDGVPYLAA